MPVMEDYALGLGDFCLREAFHAGAIRMLKSYFDVYIIANYLRSS